VTHAPKAWRRDAWGGRHVPEDEEGLVTAPRPHACERYFRGFQGETVTVPRETACKWYLRGLAVPEGWKPTPAELRAAARAVSSSTEQLRGLAVPEDGEPTPADLRAAARAAFDGIEHERRRRSLTEARR
jgi:hypothetical protein